MSILLCGCGDHNWSVGLTSFETGYVDIHCDEGEVNDIDVFDTRLFDYEFEGDFRCGSCGQEYTREGLDELARKMSDG